MEEGKSMGLLSVASVWNGYWTHSARYTIQTSWSDSKKAASDDMAALSSFNAAFIWENDKNKAAQTMYKGAFFTSSRTDESVNYI